MGKGTFSLFGHSLPRFRAGRPIQSGSLNSLADAAERAAPVPSLGSGLAYQQYPDGVAARVIPPTVAKVAKVTTAIGKMAGDTPGMGEIALYALVNGVLLETGETAKAYSILFDKGIKAGAWVKVAEVDDAWFVDTVGKCSDLVTSAGPPAPTQLPPPAVVASVQDPFSSGYPGVNGPLPGYPILPPPPYQPPPVEDYAVPFPPVLYGASSGPPDVLAFPVPPPLVWAAPPYQPVLPSVPAARVVYGSAGSAPLVTLPSVAGPVAAGGGSSPGGAVVPPPLVYGSDGSGPGSPGSPGSGGGSSGYTFHLIAASPVPPD